MRPSDGMSSNNAQIPSIMSFIKTASAASDVSALMTRFFNILKASVDFDIGAYLVDEGSHTGGRVYTSKALDKKASRDFTRSFLRRASLFCPGFSEDMLPELETSVLMDYGGAVSQARGEDMLHTFEVPLVISGESCGIVALGSYREESPFGDASTVNAMVQHLETALERLLTGSTAEEARLRNILFSMSEGVYLMDRAGRLKAVNPMALELISSFCMECMERMAGDGGDWLPLTGCGCAFGEFIRKAVMDAADGEKIRSTEIKNAEGRTLSLSVCALNAEDNWKYSRVITAKDVTDEKMLQKSLLVSSKLASIGEMVAGVAHEINNPLQAILVNMELMDGCLNDAGARRLEIIKNGVMRIKDIVKDLLIFARNETTGTEKADVNILIEKCADILRPQMKLSRIELSTGLYPNPLIADINKNLFQQVVINLLQNAKDAMEEAGIGTKVAVSSSLQPDMRIEIKVEDDGPGIPEDIIDKVFDPFFTTKDVGKGTGLGLSVSRKIVEKMGGQIAVKSALRRGTAFSVTIPHCGAVIDERRKQRYRAPDKEAIAGKTVLIADDEPVILNTLKEAISGHVLGVDTAVNGADALEKIRTRDYDLIFLDINMPVMNGMEFFGKLAMEKPHLGGRIIFLTGDTENEKTSEFLKFTKCKYLCKPLGVKEILGAMCEVVLKADSTSNN